MKTKSGFSLLIMIYGIIITVLMLLIFGGTLIGDIIEKGPGEYKKIASALVHWYDDPTGFFFTYIIGYAVIWWKSLPGSIIIIAGSLCAAIINIDNLLGFLIFAIPTFLVGFLYLISWFDNRKTNKISSDRVV
jgi:hypothetical protein